MIQHNNTHNNNDKIIMLGINALAQKPHFLPSLCPHWLCTAPPQHCWDPLSPSLPPGTLGAEGAPGPGRAHHRPCCIRSPARLPGCHDAPRATNICCLNAQILGDPADKGQTVLNLLNYTLRVAWTQAILKINSHVAV